MKLPLELIPYGGHYVPLMKYTAFDIETTGFDPRQEAIVEIAAVKFDGGAAVDRFTALVNPGRPIPVEVQRVHGIGDAMVVDAPLICEVLEPFADFCGSDILVAHNAPFDHGFLCAAMHRHARRAPRGLILDTCMLARRILPGMINYKLATLSRFFEFNAGDFHRAEVDAVYCGMLFRELLKRQQALDPSQGLEELVRLSGERALRFPQPTSADLQMGLFD